MYKDLNIVELLTMLRIVLQIN